MNNESENLRIYHVEETRKSKSFEATLEEIVTGFRSGKIEGDQMVSMMIDGDNKWFTVADLCKNARDMKSVSSIKSLGPQEAGTPPATSPTPPNKRVGVAIFAVVSSGIMCVLPFGLASNDIGFFWHWHVFVAELLLWTVILILSLCLLATTGSPWRTRRTFAYMALITAYAAIGFHAFCGAAGFMDYGKWDMDQMVLLLAPGILSAFSVTLASRLILKSTRISDVGPYESAKAKRLRRKTIEVEVSRKYEEELAGTNDYWKRTEIEDKIKKEIKQRLNHPTTLENTGDLQQRGLKSVPAKGSQPIR